MTDPIKEQITQNIVQALCTITLANGFNYDLIIEREKRRGNAKRDLLVIVYEKDPQTDTETPMLMNSWLQNYGLDVLVTVSEDEEETVFPSAKLNRIEADIVKVLMADRHRNNLAIDTKILPSSDWSAINGDYEGRQVNLQVQYRTNELDPYQILG